MAAEQDSTDAPRARPVLVRQASASDVNDVCAMLSRAFDDDPISNYLLPSTRRRAAGLRTFFRVQIEKEYLAYGNVYTTDDHAGAAVWAPPDKPMLKGLRGIAAVLPVAPYVVGTTLLRSLRFLSRIVEVHPKEPHWYLATLGTEPARQSQGVGSALMAPVLARCDAEGMRAYLESSKERNIPFYRRHGFEVTGELRFDDSPPLWTMWRDPREPSDEG
jgi:ribosomal protein S18 acetylase RimI-like enzyme